MEEEMEELYVEGLATHGDPESCVDDPQGRGEALTGARAGRAIEPRNHESGVPTLFTRWKATPPLETRRTPTSMLGSAILELSSNLQQDVDGERYMVGTHFAELMRTDPMTATVLLLSILQLPRLYQFAPAADWREPPSVRQGAPLAFAGGHQVLITMVNEFSRGLQDLAEAGARVVPDIGQPDCRCRKRMPPGRMHRGGHRVSARAWRLVAGLHAGDRAMIFGLWA
jgi:hypothetical protein